MKLSLGHLKGIPDFERKLYKQLIGPVTVSHRKDTFLAKSQTYKKGDERVLPYPERSSRGLLLNKLCKAVGASEYVLVLWPQSQVHARFLREKVCFVAHRQPCFLVSSQELSACILAEVSGTKSPFDHWRSAQLPLKGLPLTGKGIALCQPPEEFLDAESQEYKLIGAYIKPGTDIRQAIYSIETLLESKHILGVLRVLGAQGLSQVQLLDEGHLWLTAPQTC